MDPLRLWRRQLSSLLLVCAAGTITGQAPTGSIAGEIHDPAGASVSEAQLVLRDVATETVRSTTASRLGSYEFPKLSPGVYDLSIEARGFRRTVERHIVVYVGSAVHLDVTMPLGDVRETVEVVAEPPLIEPDKVSIGSIVDLRSIQNLPLEDRQFLNLALLVPGTIPGAPGTRVAGSSIETFSVGGMRSQSNNYTLDGINNNDPHNDGPLNLFRIADAVQEFRVETSIPGEEAGRNSGAQVSIITKSGGNAYHGTLFYYTRNDAFDATPFFLNRAGLPKNPLHRSQFGGTVGGFIRRDKTFWFASFEGYDQSVQDPATSRVPTDAERAEVTDPVSQSLLPFWPRANTPQLMLATGMNWTGTTPDKAQDETYLWRIDQNLTNKHQFTGRFVWLTGSTLARQTSPFDGAINNSPQQSSLLVQDTYSTNHLVNEARFGYSRNKAFLQPADAKINPALIFTDGTGKPMPGYIDTRLNPLNGGLPTITITGFTNGGLGVGGSYPQGRTTNTYEFLDDLSVIGSLGHRRNVLNLGGGVRIETANLFLNAFFRGSISFANWNAFASGQPSKGSLATGTDETIREWSRVPVYLYAQDEFKPRANLTVNFGLRWEYPGSMKEMDNRGSNFVAGVGQMVLDSNSRIDVDPTQLGRAALLQTPVGIRLPRSGQFSVPKNLSPFIGVAYSPTIWPRPFAHGFTVIRAGFRISYDDIFDDIPSLIGLNYPSVLSTTLPRGSYTWATVLNQNLRMFAPDPTVLPQGERGILTFSSIDTHPSSPYSMNYAFEIQRQLGKSLSLEISYAGSQGRKLMVALDANQPVVTVNDITKRGDQAPNQRAFPFPQYSNLLQAAFVSNSNFNGLTLVAHKQATRGLSVTASYEMSKSLDDNSGFFPSDGDTSIYADSKNRAQNYGPSTFDTRQHVIASFVYQLPSGFPGAFGRRGVPRLLLEDWTISGVTDFRSGFPFTVRASSDTDFTGLNRWTPAGGFSDRVDMKPGVIVVPQNMSDPDNAFDPGVFSFPEAGRPGSFGRNSLIGPDMIEQDFAIVRDLPIRKAQQAQFRVEFFNLLNHTNFQLPENRLDQSSVGKIGDSYDPRLIQLSFRFQW